MIRIQVRFDEDEYSLIRNRARALDISMAEFIRRAVRDALPANGPAPWMRFSGWTETEDPRSSQSIDDVVYGQKG